jgi:hypothetical protein
MSARQNHVRVLLGCLLASSLLPLAGCSLPPALSKAELDSGKLSDKHPKLSAEKVKAGCRSCHREVEEAKVTQ